VKCSYEIAYPGAPDQGHRLLHNCIDAWRGAGFTNIFVYGDAERISPLLARDDYSKLVKVLPEPKGGTTSLSASVFEVLALIEPHLAEGSDRLILSASDMPFLTADSITDMLREIDRQIPADSEPSIVWPVCRVSAYKRRRGDLSGFSCTKLPLSGGELTGGNIFFVEKKKLHELRDVVEKATASRKGTLKLAWLLGPMTVLKLALSLRFAGLRFSVPELEQLVADKLNVTMRAIPCDIPGLSVDIDDKDRYDALRAYYQKWH